MEQINLLTDALSSVSPQFGEPTLRQFVDYRDLLLEWNHRINLISRRDEARIIQRHFLDSIGLLTIFPFPSKARVLDIGSGAGFPGIPMKLVRPDLAMTLIDSKRKRGLFLRRVCERLKLKGIEVIVGRIEEVGKLSGPFSILVSRSVTDLTTLVKWSVGSWEPKAKLIVIKGESVNEEVDLLQKTFDREMVVSTRIIEFDPFPVIAPRNRSFIVVVDLGPAGACGAGGCQPTD